MRDLRTTRRSGRPWLIGRVLTLSVMIGVACLLVRIPGDPGPAGTTMRLGFLLIVSFLAGRVVRGVALPQITGYILIGIVVGPQVAGIIDAVSIRRLDILNEIALSLIALSAGGELRMRTVRTRMRSIGLITVSQLLIVFGVTAATVFVGRGLFDFLDGRPPRLALAAALLFGLVAVAKSPATTIAVITEEKASGAMTDVVLGVTVIKDVIILMLTALMIPLAVMIARPGSHFDVHALEAVAMAIGLSLAIGTLFGFTISLVLRRAPQQQVLLVLAAGFLSVELAEAAGLEYILLSMAAGFTVQNFSAEGAGLVAALEKNSLPIYALFFALAGANLDIVALAHVWKIALVLLVARVLSLWLSTAAGARLAGAGSAMERHAWTGFIAMAGVTLGIANLIRERFPEVGPAMATIIVAIIAVNQLLGPPLFRNALVRAGEAGQALPRRTPSPLTIDR